MRTLLMSRGGSFSTDLRHDAIADTLKEPRVVLWLDIAGPTAEDQELLRTQFGFHPLAIEDAVREHERPKVNAYGGALDRDGDGVPDLQLEDAAASGRPGSGGPPAPAEGAAAAPEVEAPDDGLAEGILIPLARAGAADLEDVGRGSYYFVVFYAAAFKPQTDEIETQPVSLFIGTNYLVTVHHGAVPHVAETMARWRTPGGPLGHRVGELVHALLDAMVDDYFPLMDGVADRVEELEDTIFTHFDEQSIHAIFRLKKDLMAMRRVVTPERDVLNVLLRRQLPIFSPDDVAYLQDVYDHIVRVTDSIDTYRDLVSSALDSYLSLQSNKLNVIVKTLTIASIVLMSCALVAGIYGMNFQFMPELRQPWGYPFALGLMGLISTSLILFFRWRRWL